MKIYIAGKITGDKNYREKFEKVASSLREHGFSVMNPACLRIRNSVGTIIWQYLRRCRRRVMRRCYCLIGKRARGHGLSCTQRNS